MGARHSYYPRLGIDLDLLSDRLGNVIEIGNLFLRRTALRISTSPRSRNRQPKYQQIRGRQKQTRQRKAKFSMTSRAGYR